MLLNDDSLNNAAPKELATARQLTINPFPIFETAIEVIKEALETNLGDSDVNRRGLERIKIPGGGGTIWSLPGLGGEENYENLSVIILAFRDTRAYWPETLEKSGGNKNPECSSPNARVGNPFGECSTCRFAKPKSGPNGIGQACKLTRELFVVRQGNVWFEVMPLPPTSIFPNADYLRRL